MNDDEDDDIGWEGEHHVSAIDFQSLVEIRSAFVLWSWYQLRYKTDHQHEPLSRINVDFINRSHLECFYLHSTNGRCTERTALLQGAIAANLTVPWR